MLFGVRTQTQALPVWSLPIGFAAFLVGRAGKAYHPILSPHLNIYIYITYIFLLKERQSKDLICSDVY